MGKVLVTGANGHLGNNLVRQLLAQGREVRVMVRQGSNLTGLDGLDVERVYGDLLDKETINQAVSGCSVVYHAAAAFLFWSKNVQREIIEPTVEGSNAVLQAVEKCGVEKLVYVSSSGTVGFETVPGRCRDETHFAGECQTAYLRAKLEAERAALKIQKRAGLPVVFVLPGLILGPGFYRVSSSVKLVSDYLNMPNPTYFDGGFSVVDVEDVARGAILAEAKGRIGERYLLAGENMLVKDFFDAVAELTGLAAPKFRAPRLVMRSLAVVMENWTSLFGGSPMITREQVDEFLGSYGYFSSEKAKRELGYTFLPYKQVLWRTINWLLEHGFVTDSRRKAISLGSAPAG